MQSTVRIGLVGDFNPQVVAHQAIPIALKLAGEAAAVSVECAWVPTEEVQDAARLSGFTGLWCVPASPYRSMEGALRAIRFAREQGRPFLGTCGGFQHAVIEYARNVLGWADADHAETAPDAVRAVITPLECALVEAKGGVRFSSGSRIANAYRVSAATEGYHCRYGLNPEFEAALVAGPLRATARDEAGEVRAVELDGHPFFVATLFQPERIALQGVVPPLVTAFVRACEAIARPVATKVIETERLILRQLDVPDAAFILKLLNEPSFLRFIGDRGVRTLEDARTYILKGPVSSYQRFGFGLFLVELKPDGVPIGMCGLVKREFLQDADVGFAFMPEFWSKGYAVESAAAVLAYARDVVGLKRLIAITNQDNAGSIALLRKIGFEFERLITLPGETKEINLLATAL